MKDSIWTRKEFYLFVIHQNPLAIAGKVGCEDFCPYWSYLTQKGLTGVRVGINAIEYDRIVAKPSAGQRRKATPPWLAKFVETIDNEYCYNEHELIFWKDVRNILEGKDYDACGRATSLSR